MQVCNNFIFLDIDGVLYPCRNRKPFTNKSEDIIKELEEKHNVSFQDINPYDILCVVEGWNQNAITLLKNLLEEYNAKIIISSSWKFKFKKEILYKLFSIHDLDSYIEDIIPNSYGILKKDSITMYLKKHPEIKNYIILDDVRMTSTFKEHSIYCPDVLNEKVYQKAKSILNKYMR